MGALQQGFAILDAVADAGKDGLTFSQAAAASGVPKASAHRLMRELVTLGALDYQRASRRYRGGMQLARLGARVLADHDFRSVARPHLQALQAATGHVATLGILDDGDGVYIDKIDSGDFGIRLHSEIGKRFPLHCTAMGKMLLAHADRETQRRALGRKLRVFTENTISTPARLRRALDEALAQGYAVDREEITRGLICVAAPVFGADGNVEGAMSATLPAHAAGASQLPTLIDAVCRHAAAASLADAARAPG